MLSEWLLWLLVLLLEQGIAEDEATELSSLKKDSSLAESVIKLLALSFCEGGGVNVGGVGEGVVKGGV